MLIKALFVYCVIGLVLTVCLQALRSLSLSVSVFDGMAWHEVVLCVVISVWVMPVGCVVCLAVELRDLYLYHKEEKS